MLGTLVKEHQRTQKCSWMIRPGSQQLTNPPTPPGIPQEAGTWTRSHFPKTGTTRTFCGTSVDSLLILDVVEPNQSQFEPLRPAADPVLSVPDSRIFCACPSPALHLIRSFMELWFGTRSPVGWNPECSDRSAENVRSQSGLQSHGAPQWIRAGRTGTSMKTKGLEGGVSTLTSNSSNI